MLVHVCKHAGEVDVTWGGGHRIVTLAGAEEGEEEEDEEQIFFTTTLESQIAVALPLFAHINLNSFRFRNSTTS